MKTTFTLLKWICLLATLPLVLQGFLLPVLRSPPIWGQNTTNAEELFLLFLSIPFVVLAILFDRWANKRQWEDDFFYLLFNFYVSKLKNKVKKTKDTLKDNLDKEKR